MSVDSAFAPYRLAPGALAEEAARAAEAQSAEPLLAVPADPLPAPLVSRSLAVVAAGRAAPGAEPCRAADGSVAGGGGAARACLNSDRQRDRVAEAARGALAAGFAGVCLDRPDASLALGLLGAGFCDDCQRDLARELVREYGDNFQPPDYLALVREAVVQAPGAISFTQLPFGRDFWRARNEALVRAVRDHARAARDASRMAARPFEIVAQLEAIGPAQLRAVRHLDAAIFPASVRPEESGIGLFRLLRAASGRRPCAVIAPPLAEHPLARFAAVAASCGIDLSGVLPGRGREVAPVRKLARRLQAHSLGPTSGDPVAECAVLYSAEADLWTGGRHRRAVVRAAELLAAAQVQAPVVTRVADAPADATLVLADARGLLPFEAKASLQRLEGGGALLAFGEAAAVDETGRPGASFLPSARPTGTKVGAGTLAALPSLEGEEGESGDRAEQADALDRALVAVRGKGRRAAGLAARLPLLVVLHRTAGAVLAHLVAPEGERVQGATLFLGVHVAGGARRARFVSTDGTDVRIPLNPSGYSLSTVLPAFRGYAVLSIAA